MYGHVCKIDYLLGISEIVAAFIFVSNLLLSFFQLSVK